MLLQQVTLLSHYLCAVVWHNELHQQECKNGRAYTRIKGHKASQESKKSDSQKKDAETRAKKKAHHDTIECARNLATFKHHCMVLEEAASNRPTALPFGGNEQQLHTEQDMLVDAVELKAFHTGPSSSIPEKSQHNWMEEMMRIKMVTNNKTKTQMLLMYWIFH
ncbi:hypothetical protein MHU86_10239 [Fragilaria crotonensis]|nr:hypothetical protein MHU86_10239 [Fragilaria crotonensis]